jgi:hypothetical protein
MSVPVDTTYQPQYVTSPADTVKPVDYPYNLVNEFTVTCYTKETVDPNKEAILLDSNGNQISKSPLTAGGTFEFAGVRIFSAHAKFTLDHPLPGPKVTVVMPQELFDPAGTKLIFMFGEFVKPDNEYLI